jgi:UDP-glucose:(heptosyl)LPS alpha-1,3-glucosyltransferase
MGGERQNRPLKIAILLDKFLPSRGGERYFSFLCAELSKRGHEVHLFATEAEAVAGLPYRVRRIPVWKYPRWLRALSLWRYGSGTLTRQGFDIVHAVAQCRAATVLNPHGGVERAYLRQEFASITNPAYYAYKLVKRYLSVRHYLEIHLQNRLYAAGADQDTPRRQSYARKAPGGVRHVIAISQMVKADIIRYYAYPTDRISVVFNTVDLDRFHPRMREVYRAERRTGLGVGADSILLLFAGNNFRLKGLETLLRALALLTAQFPDRDFRLLVAGRGRPRRYRRLMKKLGIAARVIFAGPLSPMERYYAAADIYVHPTFYDSCSLTVLEALATGLPAVTTRFNGAAQVIASQEGGMVIDDPADAAELAAAVALYADPEKRAAARIVARAWMEQYPPMRNVEETERAYYQALSE